MAIYRIVFETGQSGTHKRTFAEARRELTSYRGLEHAGEFHIDESRDGGQTWRSMGAAGRLRTAATQKGI